MTLDRVLIATVDSHIDHLTSELTSVADTAVAAAFDVVEGVGGAFTSSLVFTAVPTLMLIF